MFLIKFIVTVVVAFAFWLLYGAPNLDEVGNLFIFGCTIVHLFMIVWNRETFKLFGGDEFTYGMAALGMNVATFFWTFIAGILILKFYGDSNHDIARFNQVPNPVWGLLLIGLVLSLALQIFSTRHVSKLPKIEDRRKFEPPRSN